MLSCSQASRSPKGCVYSLRSLLLGSGVIAAVLGMWRWLSHSELYVREAPAGTQAVRCILPNTVVPDDDGRESGVRVVCEVRGRLRRGHKLTARLYLVRGGSTRDVSVVVAPAYAHRLPVRHADFQLLLQERPALRGRRVTLGIGGSAGGCAIGSTVLVDHDVGIGRIVPEIVPSGRAAVAYAEGNVLPIILPQMSLAQFEQMNRSGEHLVITVEQK